VSRIIWMVPKYNNQKTVIFLTLCTTLENQNIDTELSQY